MNEGPSVAGGVEAWEHLDVGASYGEWWRLEREKLKDRVLMFDLPVPPSVNMAFRNVAGKGRVRTKKYVGWAKEAGWMVKAQHVGRIGGKVTVDIGVKRVPNSDIDNRIKPLLDLLVTFGVIDDDRHVERVAAQWRDDIDGARVTVARA